MPTSVATVVLQHLDESVALRTTRSVLVKAPHIGLLRLGRLDERLVAHLDGLAQGGASAWRQCVAALETPDPGLLFTAGVIAITDHQLAALERLLAVAETLTAVRPGLVSAFGWVSAALLKGITAPLLGSDNPFRQQIGLAACRMHQVDPGPALRMSLSHPDPALRCRALVVAGENGQLDLLPLCLEALLEKEATFQLQAARSALLLGDRGRSVDYLQAWVAQDSPSRPQALALLLKVLPAAQASALLKTLAQDGNQARTLVRAIGQAGDPLYVPWLIKQMGELELARLAGESFSLLTGLDLAWLDLDRKPPGNLEAAPDDNPLDDNVTLDEDESLPWPDPGKISDWWAANGQRFAPGTRYFMGEPPSPAHCLGVLKNGFQRQRIAAAEYQVLMHPGTPLFNTAAPARRQQRLLAQMSA